MRRPRRARCKNHGVGRRTDAADRRPLRRLRLHKTGGGNGRQPAENDNTDRQCRKALPKNPRGDIPPGFMLRKRVCLNRILSISRWFESRCHQHPCRPVLDRDDRASVSAWRTSK